MKQQVMILAAVLVAAAVTAEAQQLPPGKWWQRPEVVRELQLTREQQDRLDTTFRDSADGLIDAKADVEKLQVALRGEIDRPQLRRQEIQQLAAKVSEARARLFERELMLLVDMRGILTEPQWDRLRAHLDRREDPRGMGPMNPRPNRRPGAGRRP